MSVDRAARNYVFSPMPVEALPIAGSNLFFPIHRIYCVGQNYADHVKEMGNDPSKQAPAFFQKSPDCIALSGAEFPYPSSSQNVHYEIELVVALGAGGVDIPADRALDLVYGYAAGLDMTCRDLQSEAKKTGRSWEAAKSFEASAPCSAIAPADLVGHPRDGRLWLKLNDELRQDGDIDHMIWKTPEIIAYLSHFFTLHPGDLIFTGTPSGVGPVQRGDKIAAGVEGIGEISVTVV
jgi:fumarylpyruvate hydrolase